MTGTTTKPTRREQRRVQTVQEIKALAMEQIRVGGPEAVSLSGIVREMAMSPAAIYRYFENRDALLGELVVDAYSEFADSLVSAESAKSPAPPNLAAILNAVRTWALEHPNSYRLIFHTGLGSGQELDAERTKAASTRSMAAIVTALAAVRADGGAGPGATPSADSAIEQWSERSGLTEFPLEVLTLGLTAWTRLHGVISLELGGHLAATGLDPGVLYEGEVAALVAAAGGRS